MAVSVPGKGDLWARRIWRNRGKFHSGKKHKFKWKM